MMDARSRVLGAVLAAVLAALGGAPDAASAGPPTERLRQFFDAVNAIVTDPATEDQPLERLRRIRGLVDEVGDFREAAALALGPHWRARSPAEQAEFVRLFAGLLERAWVGRLAGRARLGEGIRIEYLDESLAGEAATVGVSMAARDGGDVRLEFRMLHRGGRWFVRDLVLDGVSTVENYQAQFTRILRDTSYPALLAQMRAKLAAESVFAAAPAIASTAPPVEPEPPEPARAEALAGVRPDPGVVEGRREVVPPPSAPSAAPPRAAPTPRARGMAPAATDTGAARGARPAPPPAPVETVADLARASAPAPAPTPPTAATPALWVQVAAFRSAEAAGRLASRLRGDILVVPPPMAGPPLLRVRVGPFAERAQALAKLRELEALGLRPFIASD